MTINVVTFWCEVIKSMLDLAHKYEDEIRVKMFDTWYDTKYKFYHSSVYHDIYSLDGNNGDWDSRQFVSLNSFGNILGLIGYGIDRTTEIANGFGAINFSDDKFTFGLDLGKVIDDIFCKFNMRKLEFSVVVGNPIEKSYDKMVVKYGGQVAGILKAHYKLVDNNYYDEKMYEIFRDDYIAVKEKRIKC